MNDEYPPKRAADWSQRYRDQDTPWDVGAPHPELARRIAAGELAPADIAPNCAEPHALVPGAGYGHDALALARAGWRVTALDFAEGVEGGPASELATLGGRFLAEDALAFGAPGTPDAGRYDLVFDHTFFCALHPDERPRWAAMVDRCLAPDGELVAIVFPGGKPHANGGPPWGTELEHVLAALGDGFEVTLHEPVQETLERRDWAEFWGRFRRNR